MGGVDGACKEAILYRSLISSCQSAYVHALYRAAIGKCIFRVIIVQSGLAVAVGHGGATCVRGPRLCHDAAGGDFSVAHDCRPDISALYRNLFEMSVGAYAEQGMVDAVDRIPSTVVVASKGVAVGADGNPLYIRQVDGGYLPGIDGEVVVHHITEPLHGSQIAYLIVSVVESRDIGIELFVVIAKFADKFFRAGNGGSVACIVVLA